MTLRQSWPCACQLPLKSVASSDVLKALKDRSSANLSSSCPAPPYWTPDADSMAPQHNSHINPLAGALHFSVGPFLLLEAQSSSLWSEMLCYRKNSGAHPETCSTHLHLVSTRLFGCEMWSLLDWVRDSSPMSWHRAPSPILADPAQLSPSLHHPEAMGTMSQAELMEGQLIKACLNFYPW